MFDLSPDQLSRAAILAIVFVVVVGLVLLIGGSVGERRTLVRRLEETQPQVRLSEDGASLRTQSAQTAWTRLIEAIERRGISLADTRDASVRAKLAAAGFTASEAPRLFTLIRLVLTLGLPALVVGLALASNNPPSMLKLYLIGGCLALLGLYLPNLFVAARAARRQEELVNGFPDALDLMLVCVEAGLGVEAAFDRVGREMSISHPLVSQMMANVVLQLRAGQSREEAMRRMGETVQIDEIRSFATLLIQSDRLGSSIAQTLRVYAAEMREKRRLRAEEKAHRLPVLLSIPLVVCMLPVMIGVLMLPAGIRVIRQLAPALAGG